MAITLPTVTYVPKDFCVGDANYSTSDCAVSDSEQQEQYIVEAINASGGPVNVYPMLGLTRLYSVDDITGSGYPLSGGVATGSNVNNAFESTGNPWESSQTGPGVLSGAYLGYNFGFVLQTSGVQRNAPGAPLRRHVRTIKIQQGDVATTRVIQARIEACDDGINWVRICAVNLPNTSNLETITISNPVEYSQWRVVPLMFNGITTGDPWIVTRLMFTEENQQVLDEVEDLVFMENRNRDYQSVPIQIKTQYELQETLTFQFNFGGSPDMQQEWNFIVPFSTMVTAIGRPIVTGDLLELPSEMQYDNNLRGIRKWLEVTDTMWSQDGYTVDWKPTLYRFKAVPATASTETKKLFGSAGDIKDTTKQVDNEMLNSVFGINTQGQQIADELRGLSLDAVPENGIDTTGLTPELPNGHVMFDPKEFADGIPSDGAPFTEGSVFPANPADGDYHRMTYPNTELAVRLYRFNEIKQSWVYMETDLRAVPTYLKPVIYQHIISENSISPKDRF